MQGINLKYPEMNSASAGMQKKLIATARQTRFFVFNEAVSSDRVSPKPAPNMLPKIKINEKNKDIMWINKSMILDYTLFPRLMSYARTQLDHYPNVIFDGKSFMDVFANDLAMANKEIIIVCPYLKKSRLEQILRLL
jgi:hypothetical protein